MTASREPVLVVDTSAIIEVVAGRSPEPQLVERLGADGDLHAPHLVDVEVLHALRRLTLGGDLTEDRAQDARKDFADLSLVRYPHHPLADRAWALRHNLTAYDAVFVALAEALDTALVTCDRRLATASGTRAAIELYGAS